VSKVAPIDKLSIVFAIVLGVVVLGEPLTLSVVAGGVLMVAGAAIIILF
jgi:transporter family protein